MKPHGRCIPWLFSLAALLVAGCTGEPTIDNTPSAPVATPTRPAAPLPSAPRLGAPANMPTDTNAADNSSVDTGAADSGTPPSAAAEGDIADGDAQPPEGERVKAEAGVGKRGRGYGGGIISEPVRAYFGVRQRIQFLQMEKGMKEFKAIHNRAPASHEEFMEKIINEYGVELPDLPEGESYVYDPEQEELMVQKPAP